MTQTQFMYELMVAAEDFPDEVKFALVNDYNRHFAEMLDSGKTESEITAVLPSPQEIAESYVKGEPITPGGAHDGGEGGATPLGVFLFILMIPVLIVYESLAFVVGLLTAILLLALCVAAAFASVASFGVMGLSRGFILLGIGGLFVTVALVLVSVAAFRGIASGFAWFPRLMGRTLRFKRGGAA